MDEQKNEISARQMREAWLKDPKQKDPKKDNVLTENSSMLDILRALVEKANRIPDKVIEHESEKKEG